MTTLTFKFENSDPYTTGEMPEARADRVAEQIAVKVEKVNPGLVKQDGKIKTQKQKRLKKNDDSNLLEVDVT